MGEFLYAHDQSEKMLSCTILSSRFDAPIVPEFQRSLQEAWRPEIQSMTLDLAHVDFIDSSGIGALLGLQKKLPENAEPLKLIHVKTSVADIFELLRLHRIFNLHTDET